MGKGIGDRLASGRATSAQFPAGVAKVGDKVQIAPGIVATEETRSILDKGRKYAAASAKSAPRTVSRLEPMYDQIHVRPEAEEAVTDGGLFIPDEAKDRPMQGTVLNVGFGRVQPDGSIRPLYLKGGETVLYGKYSGVEVKIDGEVLLMMAETEVLAILHKEKK